MYADRARRIWDRDVRSGIDGMGEFVLESGVVSYTRISR